MQTATPLDNLLTSQGFAVLDGGLATELETRGADLTDSLWSARLLLTDPQSIRDVHQDYLAAGADIIISATYQASIEGFMARALSYADAKMLLQSGVAIALEARDSFWSRQRDTTRRQRPLVAASIGPYGAYLADGSEYHGIYAIDQAALIAWHRPRLALLSACGADLLACETIPSRLEAEALGALLAEIPGPPAWISFSCRDGRTLVSGDEWTETVSALSGHPRIAAIGINCTAPKFAEELLARAATVTDLPLVCYPNRGEDWDSVHHCWVANGNDAEIAKQVPAWYATGARLIGGCCRTGPHDIRAIADQLRGIDRSESRRRVSDRRHGSGEEEPGGIR